MDYIGVKIKVINFDGWPVNFKELYIKTDEYIGSTGKIKNTNMNNDAFTIDFDDKYLQVIDHQNLKLCFFKNNLEFVEDTYVHIKQPKPPLGVMPKDIYEFQRVMDLCRALYERSVFEELDYDLMIKWSDELNDRLYGLKGDIL